MRDILRDIIARPLTDMQWEQAKLPVGMGGLGIRSAQDHCSAAFIASVLASVPLVQESVSADLMNIAPSVIHLRSVTGEEVTEEGLQGLRQKDLSYKVDVFNRETLMSGCDSTREKARLGSLSLPHAGNYLNVVPSPILGLHLWEKEFRLIVCYRLGIDVFDKEGPCPACHRFSDSLGDHVIL